jgi:hypothetical protein
MQYVLTQEELDELKGNQKQVAKILSEYNTRKLNHLFECIQKCFSQNRSFEFPAETIQRAIKVHHEEFKEESPCS